MRYGLAQHDPMIAAAMAPNFLGTVLQIGAGFQEGSDMLKCVTIIVGYLMLVSTTALAQATPTTTADIPWVWIIAGIIIVGGIVWWYMNRSRGPRV